MKLTDKQVMMLCVLVAIGLIAVAYAALVSGITQLQVTIVATIGGLCLGMAVGLHRGTTSK